MRWVSLVEDSNALIDRYFTVMGSGGDFSECFTDDVTWAVDEGLEIRGKSAVRDYIVDLHARKGAQLSDGRTRRIAVSEDAAYLEGDRIDPRTAEPARFFYCVAYDLKDSRISAMRCYGAFRSVLSDRKPD
jgi:hypothetical protein